MPSLWKKQKGSKISRLVVDLQTTSPKRREALIVENGVSPSMVDVFGKSKDKLHKLSLKKKHRSKKHNTSLTMEEHNYPLPRLPTLARTFIVVVSLYTKRTILGVSIGAFVLFLLEIVKKVIKPKHGQDVPNVEQNEIQKEESGKENVDVILNEGVDMYLDKDVQENGVLTNGTETEDGGNEANVKDGTTRCLKVKIIKQGDSDSELVKNGSDEEKIWNEIVSEIDSLDKSYSIWPRQNQPFDDGTPIGSGEQLGKTEMMSNIDECSNMFDQIDKVKKRRKFWKKLVPKHIRKSKKNKHGKEAHDSSVHCLDDSTTEMEDNEMDEKEETFSISSNDDNKDEEDECFNIVNNSYAETLQVKDDNKCYFGMKGMIVLVIPLVGLIGGRFLAFVLTIVACVMHSMLRG
ncbi:uncharacterized protein LOC141617480 isoform X1 [Silene latifolia]|uniref:uncharacterized protein LOC141617480 isoform X1 n=1 Tax=Silene latifolia TaxID=37657 RepID=UPI003D76D7D7